MQDTVSIQDFMQARRVVSTKGGAFTGLIHEVSRGEYKCRVVNAQGVTVWTAVYIRHLTEVVGILQDVIKEHKALQAIK